MFFSKLKYIIIDVDGTLTDGSIYYDENGKELKKFNTKDAAGIFSAKKIGIKIVIMTGRKCLATQKRMSELEVDYIYQNIKDKTEFLLNFMKEHNISKEEIGYIGDDLNDYQSMKETGFIACPADACREIKEIAHYVSKVNGGYGAVRDIIEENMRNENLWESAIKDIYNIGI